MDTTPTTPSDVSSVALAHGGQLRRHIGPVGLLFTGVGSIIGSGWLFGALNASRLAGPAAILSWAIGGVMILLIGLVYAELGAMFPVGGGVVRFPHWSFGSFASYTMGWVTWIAAATVAPIEVEGALQYATHYVHWLTTQSGGVPVLTPAGYAVAVVAMMLFCLVNIVGIRAFARLNNVLVWWKLAIISLVVLVFLFSSFHASNFHLHGFAPAGAHGVFSSIATAGIVFSFLGFRQGVELAGESDNPRRAVPIAVVGSVLITMLIYLALQAAFVGALRPGDLGQGWSALSFTGDAGPLAALATILGLGWLAALLYFDAVVSPADTGLIYTTVTARISYAMGRNENAPRVLASLSQRGVPWVSVALTFLVGCVVFLPFPGWQKLVGFITSATVLSFGSGPLVLAAMRRQLPDHARPFRLPGGHLIPFLAFYSSNLIVYWAGWDVNWKLFVAILLGFVLLAVHTARSGANRPAMDWRAGWWVLPWFAGLALVSWLGSYSSDGADHGQVGLIGLGWGFVVIAAFSIVIYLVALHSRLPGRRTEELSSATGEVHGV
jgi:amino acid transporter